MSLKDYYLANAGDESKLYLYDIVGDSVLKMKYKDCIITVGGKTLEEAKQRLNRLLNNTITEEDIVMGADVVLKYLKNYENIRIKKMKVKVINGEISPRYPWIYGWVIDDEMIAYEKELLKV